jgi:hypothetical protein
MPWLLYPIEEETEWAPKLVSVLWSRGKSLAPAWNRNLVIQPIGHYYAI